MSGFEHLAVVDGFGPHVTPIAGVVIGGRHWATTSAAAAKVRALRARPHAAILAVDDGRTTLTVGPATVLDVRRPLEGLADPAAVGLAGVALARLGLAHADQLAGYVADARQIPVAWRLRGRVLIVVKPEHQLVWQDSVEEASGPFASGRELAVPTRRRRTPLSGRVAAALPAAVRHMIASPQRCVVGLMGGTGPVVLPGRWDPAGAVAVEGEPLRRIAASLPGPCAVTFDASDDPRPTAKFGLMLRGTADLLATRRSTAGDTCELAISVRRATTWSGFDTATRRAG